MPNQINQIYCYDGSFDGLLCCIFESYEKSEIPLDILPSAASQPLLLPVKTIITDPSKSQRVLASIPEKIGSQALDFIRRVFLTCFKQKELYSLLFLRMGYQHGPSVMSMLTDKVVNKLFQAVRHMERESQLLKGFVRFSIINNALVAEIEPKNYVLPLLAPHFCGRYPEERFLIYDKAHGMGLVYQPYKSAIFPIDNLELPQPDQEEQSYRELWQLFYNTIAIEGRNNPKCRMNHMPKRYWKYLTEFSDLKSNNTLEQAIFLTQNSN